MAEIDFSSRIAGSNGPVASARSNAAIRSTGHTSLSELLMQDLRIENGVASVLEIGEDQVVHVVCTRKPTIYAVLEGGLAIQAGRHAVKLKAGEVGIIFYGDAHALGSGHQSHELAAPVIKMRSADTVGFIKLGDVPRQALVLQCSVQLTYLGKTAHSNRAAPAIMALLQPSDGSLETGLPVFPYDPQATPSPARNHRPTYRR